MPNFILTGAPGSGKTSILRSLRDRGHSVVAEAATDIIAAEQASGVPEPWLSPLFIDKIIELQWRRQLDQDGGPERLVFFDRSPVCTLALARYLGHPVGSALSREISRIVREGSYDRRAFLVRPIGFVQPTAARRISYRDALEFERVHEAEYRKLGFVLIDIPPGTVAARARLITAGLPSAGQACPG